MKQITPNTRYIEENFKYDPETGDLYRKVGSGNCAAGKARETGYKMAFVDGRYVYAHRIAWYLMTGEWPLHPIDHANRDSLDNRWENLRKANKSLNGANKRTPANTTSGHRGVYPTENGKWGARIKVQNKVHSLGRFDRKEDAIEAYKQAAIHHFGEFAVTGG
jgi:hypothetical protein